MSTIFRATTEADCKRLSAFLRETFGVSDDSPLVNHDNLRWKYWAARPDWSAGSRSFVLQKDDTILAHGCIWPFTLLRQNVRITGSNVIDWAAGKKSAGAGAAIFKRLCALVNCTIALHGGETTQRVLPMIGFKPSGEMWSYVRPVRPLQQMITHPYRNWKLPVRLVRNTMWSLWPKHNTHGWRAREIPPSELPADFLERGRATKFEPERSREFYEYVLRCPVARTRLLLLARDGRDSGYFVLSVVPGQARIAELWMAESDPDGWASAYTLAAETARAGGANEVIALCAPDSPARVGLERAGYRYYGKTPVNCFVTPGTVCPEMELAMIDGDESFQHHGHITYAS